VFSNKIVVFACAASAGAHAGLVPEHLYAEPRVGVAFLVAIVLLLATTAALTIRPDDPRIATAAAVLFASLIVAYAASRTTGIPLLAPDREALDTVGVATKVVEVAGLALALWLSQPSGRRRRRPTLQEVPR
jgi:hypothetical protein